MSERPNPAAVRPTSQGEWEWVWRSRAGATERMALTQKVHAIGSSELSLLREAGRYALVPLVSEVRVNGCSVTTKTELRALDIVEWPGGQAILLETPPATGHARAGAHASDAGSPEAGLSAMRILHELAQKLQSGADASDAAQYLLQSLVRASGAEDGFLFSERGSGLAGVRWDVAASTREGLGSDRVLFSHRMVNEVIQKREPIVIESIVGNEWGSALSIMQAKVFSAAALPLNLGTRVVGVLLLQTHTPGRVIHKRLLSELALVATQAALLLGSFERETELTQAATAQPRLLGSSAPMRALLERIERLAPSSINVLVLGETGTGKELVSRALHDASPRGSGPFVAVNCSAIPETLLESTLFGHVKGAFTGATHNQKGQFELADGGTLFLDEIGDLPLALQAKLLRVLQEQKVQPLGAEKAKSIDVRVVAATHRKLVQLIEQKQWRQDLYYRLAGATIELPPLRDRLADLDELVAAFIAPLRNAQGARVSVGAEARALLQRHRWPGNVRELEQVIRRAAALARSAEITPEDLELEVLATAPEGLALDSIEALDRAQQAFTFRYVTQALAKLGGSRAALAKRLGVSERTIYRVLAQGEGA